MDSMIQRLSDVENTWAILVLAIWTGLKGPKGPTGYNRVHDHKGRSRGTDLTIFAMVYKGTGKELYNEYYSIHKEMGAFRKSDKQRYFAVLYNVDEDLSGEDGDPHPTLIGKTVNNDQLAAWSVI